jgi:hypothetical protein
MNRIETGFSCEETRTIGQYQLYSGYVLFDLSVQLIEELICGHSRLHG